MHDQLQQRAAYRAEGDVAGHQVMPGDLQERLRNGLEIAGQGPGEHQLASLSHLVHEVLGPLGRFAPQTAEHGFAGRVVLQQRHLVHEFVAGGAVHAPVVVQPLAGGENLLDVDRHVILRRFGGPPGVQPIDATAQASTVATRVGQAVDVVDAQPVDQAFADQLEYLRVGFFEHHRALDAQAAQFVDVEEASPVDVVAGGTPAGEAVVLAFEQAVQAPEAFLGGGVVMPERGFEALPGGFVLQLLGQLGT